MAGRKNPHDIVFKKSVEPKGEFSKGHDFGKNLSLDEFIDAYYSVGFQATHLGKAIKLVRQMRKEKVRIFFGFTSNIISSGLRDIITWLAKHRHVQVMVTTAGGIEEDIIKTHRPFLLGDFRADGVKLREKGINRTGNLFVPNERYIWYEKFVQRLLKRLYAEQKKTGKVFSTREFVSELGRELELRKTPNKESSFIYWAFRNNIPVFCPGLIDGATGDNVYFFKKENPDFLLDTSKDVIEMDDLSIQAEKTGALIIGGALPKHFIMNANQLREGADFTVYINTAVESDGSDAGASPEEAKSWGKAAANENSVKVWADATIAFPLLVYRAFKEKI